MIKKLLVGAATGAVVALASFSSTQPAAASEEKSRTIPINSSCLTGWYVNNDGDENTRLPESTEKGLVFEKNQLVHHAPEQTILIGNLNPGSYEADPAPSLSSFFSVEIINPDGSGYATLRYDSTEGKWYIGGPKPGTYTGHEENPANFVGKKNNWGTIAQDAEVISFGVGYVAHPADGTPTTVTSITFAGKTYHLDCKVQPTQTPGSGNSPTPGPTATSTPIQTQPPASPPASEGGGLPVTGVASKSVAIVGAGAIVCGAFVVALGRKRRAKATK